MRYAVLIPAYQPPETLLAYVREIAARPFAGRVLVIDDGSGQAFDALFRQVAAVKNCIVLRHEQNRGKGRALKTGLGYYLRHQEGLGGVVTVDCDSQHHIDDVAKICLAMDKYPRALTLGCRTFDDRTPQRSRIGNRLMATLMAFLYDVRIHDTQTGLRGIPNALVGGFLALKGERYEYELNMLIKARRTSIPFKLVTIRTIYFNNNEGSHFRTVADSLRLAGRMTIGILQYSGAALAAVLVDFLIFALLTKFFLSGLSPGLRITLATVAARLVSSVVNYSINRRVVFSTGANISSTLWRYYVTWGTIMILSITFVYLVTELTGLDEIIVKLVVDGLLSILSYQLQMRWVFPERGQRNRRMRERL